MRTTVYSHFNNKTTEWKGVRLTSSKVVNTVFESRWWLQKPNFKPVCILYSELGEVIDLGRDFQWRRGGLISTNIGHNVLLMLRFRHSNARGRHQLIADHMGVSPGLTFSAWLQLPRTQRRGGSKRPEHWPSDWALWEHSQGLDCPTPGSVPSKSSNSIDL